VYTKHEDALPCCFRYKWNAEHSLYEVYKKGIQLEPWLKTCLRAGLRNFSIATDLYINAVRDRSHLHLTIKNIAPKLSLSLVYVLIIFAVQRRVSIQCKNYTKHLIRTYIYIYLWNENPSGPWPPHYRGFTITSRKTTLSRTPQPDTQTSKKGLQPGNTFTQSRIG